MSDDIVTRLRICGNEYGSGEVCKEAADEIERLQADLKMFKADWQAMVKQIEYHEHENKRLKRGYLHG